MSTLDWSIVAGYLGFIVWSGIAAGRKGEGLEGYFLAHRSIPWWAVGLSVMATQMSAITLVGTTGKAYEDGLRFIQFYFGLPLALLLISFTLLPFFRRAKVYTAYEFLEKRFDAKTRTLTSFCFLLSRGLGCGVIIAAPAVVLSIVLGWSEWWTIVAIGFSTTLYTMFGGVRAVTWTDVKQMLLIVFCLGVCVFVILGKLPKGVDLSDVISLAESTGHMTAVDTEFSLRETYTLWSGLLGGFFLMLSYFGCDQSQVQRYLTARSTKEARYSLFFNAALKIPLQFLVLFIGVLVFLFYHFQAPPLIFHSAQVSELRQGELAEEYEALEGRYHEAWKQRQERASVFLQTKAETDRQAYVQSVSSAQNLREEALLLLKEERGEKSFSDINYVFPTFILQEMPSGMLGLLIAAIIAAAMSSISSELNALATTSVIDVYRRHIQLEAADAH